MQLYKNQNLDTLGKEILKTKQSEINIESLHTIEVRLNSILFSLSSLYNEEQLAQEYRNANAFITKGGEHKTKNEVEFAVQAYTSAINIFKSIPSAETKEIAQIYQNIGIAYKQAKQYDNAIANYTKSQIIYEKVIGPNSKECIVICKNIAKAYRSQHKYEKALEFCSQALSLADAMKVLALKEKASSCSEVGFIYSEQKKYAEALKYYNDVKTLTESIYGSNHLEMANCLLNIGITQSANKDDKSAIENFAKSWSIVEQNKNEANLQVKILKCQSNSYKVLGDYKKALGCDQKALLLIEKKPNSYEDIAKTCEQICNSLEKLQNKSDIIVYRTKLYESYKKLRHANTEKEGNKIISYYKSNGKQKESDAFTKDLKAYLNRK